MEPARERKCGVFYRGQWQAGIVPIVVKTYLKYSSVFENISAGFLKNE